MARFLLVVAIAAAYAGFIPGASAFAANPTVTGTVVDSGGIAQQDVVVDVLGAGGSSVVTSTITNSDGQFSVTVSSGIYDFRFTPPETSGLRTYLATGVDADHTAPLTVILKPVTVVTLAGTVRNSQGAVYANNSVYFRSTTGPTTNRSTDSTGHYTADLLSGSYYTYAGLSQFVGGNYLYSSIYFNNAIEFDQSQTYDFVVPTKTLTISVRDVDGNPVTDAAVRYDYTNVNTPAYSGAMYGGPFHVGANGNLALSAVTGITLNNPAIVLDGGLVIPFTIPTMNTDRHLYLIFDRFTGGLFLDERPPIVTGTADRPAANGWYNAPVTLTWSSVDPAPSSGAPTIPSPTTVSTEGVNQVVTSEESCDPADNCAAGHYTLSIDRTKPTISYAILPAPNANGWNNSDVTVIFTCSDALSGISTCPAPVTVDTEGANRTVTGTATDRAGNSQSVTATVKLDKTAPTITASLSQEASASGWNNSDVVVTFACTDALSGIASCPAPITLTEDGPNQTITGTAADYADNLGTVSVTVSIDKTKPLITAVRTPANGYGWNNGPVTVTYDCTDAQSGIASCSPPQTLSNEDAQQSATGTAVNNAGNSATTTVTDINIDATPPVITATIIGTLNTAGWYKTAPTVHFICSDALSGIASCPADIAVTSDGANQIVSATAYDHAGNGADVTVTGLNVDQTPPAVTVTGALNGGTYALDQLPTVGCQASDSLSGVATQATVTTTRTRDGVYTATCAGATDNADNSASPVSISYAVMPTPTSLSTLTDQYVLGSGSPSANGVSQDLENKLMHGQICQYIEKVTRESSGTNPTLTAIQAAELIYWATILDPTC